MKNLLVFVAESKVFNFYYLKKAKIYEHLPSQISQIGAIFILHRSASIQNNSGRIHTPKPLKIVSHSIFALLFILPTLFRLVFHYKYYRYLRSISIRIVNIET